MSASGAAGGVRWLTVVRHAKAEAQVAGEADRDRPLSSNGHRQAADLATSVLPALRAHGVEMPSLLLASSARRTLETAAPLAEALPEASLVVEPALYQADIDDVVERVRLVDDAVRSVLLVGHNPTFAELVAWFAADHGRDAAPSGVAETVGSDGFPTAGVAVLRLELEHWSELDPGAVRAVELWRGRGERSGVDGRSGGAQTSGQG